MMFWNIAYKSKWVTLDKLRLVVKTESNPFGEITPEQFKQITGEDFAPQE